MSMPTQFKGTAAVLLAFLCITTASAQAIDPAKGKPSDDGKVVWFDALEVGVEGQGWSTGLKHPYDRLPAEAEGVVPDPVWGLSHDSAGMCIRFITDSSSIHARWKLRSGDLAMPHMPATGVSGLDLYAKRDGKWGWIANGRPEKQENEAALFKNAPGGPIEYMIYLPLYNGIESLHIGIEPGKSLAKGEAYPESHAKPILFWGTSILQGGCASRPGMVYTSIIGRRMLRPTLNLGFSGNGRMDPPLVALIAKLDVAAYVIDCAPNMSPEEITERTEPLVKTLREAHPETPIVLVENIEYQQSWFSEGKKKSHELKNEVLKAAFDRLIAAGVKNLHYIPGTPLLGSDHEATVDGTHPNDLGFLRMADSVEPVLRNILP